LSENTTKPKNHSVKNPKRTVHTKIVESLIISPGEHSTLAQLSEEAMLFQDVQLREGRGPIINQVQFNRAVSWQHQTITALHYGIKQSRRAIRGGIWSFDPPQNFKTLHRQF